MAVNGRQCFLACFARYGRQCFLCGLWCAMVVNGFLLALLAMVVNVYFVGYGAQWSLMVFPQRSCGNGRCTKSRRA